MINSDATECNLYKGNPGDGNSRSFLAYFPDNGYTIYMAVSGNKKQGLPITGAGK